jgi:5'-methylthioadenosine phosphorylase
MAEATIGVIGGSGLYHIEGMTDVTEVKVKTPFGEPSDTIIVGMLEGVKIAFLPRHGKGHRISPTELPVRANIYALKSLGVEWIISVSAVGSLKEEIKPLDLVIPDQIIDRTRNRISTFFSGGLVGHISFAEPYCPVLNQTLYWTIQELNPDIRIHEGGIYLAMEGPQFSTKAEANLYRSWGADVIGMTHIPEAKLAREAEICYSSLCFVTDYDCWREGYEVVTGEMIVDNLQRNVATAKNIIKQVIPHLHGERECGCATALQHALITSRELIPEKVKKDLHILIGKYLDKKSLLP